MKTAPWVPGSVGRTPGGPNAPAACAPFQGASEQRRSNSRNPEKPAVLGQFLGQRFFDADIAVNGLRRTVTVLLPAAVIPEPQLFMEKV